MDSMSGTTQDAKEQIARLREQVEMLMRDRITPTLADVAGRAERSARDAQDLAREQAEALSGRVRERPLVSILVAIGVGYLIGRIVG